MGPRLQNIETRQAHTREGMVKIHAAKATEVGGSGSSRSRTKGTNGMSDIGDDARRIEVNTKMLVTSLRRVTARAKANGSETVAFVDVDTNALDSCCSLKGKQRVRHRGELLAEDVADKDAELNTGVEARRMCGRVYISSNAGFAPGSNTRSSTVRVSLT
jgi:hypothetical protein